MRYSAIVLLAACGWAQTPPEQKATEPQQNADRQILPPPREVQWKKTPFESDPYAPLAAKQKAYLFGYRIIEPTSLGKSLAAAGIAQWRNSPEEWGQGADGFAKRYADRMATRGAENAIGLGMAAALHQDPRYFRLGEGGFLQRTRHALASVLITRTDSGGKTFSVWRVSGAYGAQLTSNSWRPENNTPGDSMLRGTLSLGYGAASNMFKEFWPEIRRRLLKR